MKNLRLTSVSYVFLALMTLTGIALLSGAFFIDRNITVIKDTWTVYQTDLSEKARLESALRSAIGYGGMIHDFKNFILRQDPKYSARVKEHVGAAKAMLHQYRDMGVNSAEMMAIDDIETVLEEYMYALDDAENLIELPGITIESINEQISIDDTEALRGLSTLRYEAKQGAEEDVIANRSGVISDLRSAIGYGGMIHKFKDYVLQPEKRDLSEIEQTFFEAKKAIKQYRQFKINRAEDLALNDIEHVLFKYEENLKRISSFVSDNKQSKYIDEQVKVNDEPALKALHILDRESNAYISKNSENVNRALVFVERIIQLGTWGVVVIVLSVTLFSIWLFNSQIIKPIISLTKSMTLLANDKLDVDIDSTQRGNELGLMANSVNVFKQNMIAHKKA